MRKTPFLRRAVALALFAAVAIPTVFAHAGYQKLRTDTHLADGLTYANIITQDNSGREESFAMFLQPGGEAYPIVVQSAGTMYGKATVAKAVENAQAMGYNVLAALNSDYFASATGVPLGMVVEDGIYKCSPGEFPAVAFVNGEVRMVESPRVGITLDNVRSGKQVAMTNLNKYRTATGGLYLYSSDFSAVSTRTSGDGWVVRMKALEGELTINGAMTLEVTEWLQTDVAPAIGADEFILTAATGSGLGEVFRDFQVGDQITLNTHCQNQDLIDAQWVTGTGDLMVQNGTTTDSTAWQHSKEGRAPRTALGVRADGTAVFYVVDGRQSAYSVGLTQVELASEMIRRGCVWAVNLDGGGSSTLAVKTPGNHSPVVVNKPSDGNNRACATYILLVTDEMGDGRADRLALKQDGMVVLAGTSVELGQVLALDNGANPTERDPGEVTFSSQTELGTFDGKVYTAGPVAGTDTIELYSRNLDVEGTAQIHVVDALTVITVTEQGAGVSLSSLSMKPGDQIDLAAQGSYWSREAMRDSQGAVWAVTSGEGTGTIDENGLFTAGHKDGVITVTAGGMSKTLQVRVQNVLTDVPTSHWSYEAVSYCYQRGIVGGVSQTEFGLGLNIRRGDFVLMLYRAAGEPEVTHTSTFTDVADTDYYARAVSWAVERGVASGIGNGAFGTTDSITREQAFTMISRALPQLEIYLAEGDPAVLGAFSDRGTIAEYALPHIANLVSYRIVSGAGSMIHPKGTLTREEMASLLYKLLTFDPETVTPLPIPEPVPEITPEPTPAPTPQPTPEPQPTPGTPPAPEGEPAVGKGTVHGASSGLNVRGGPGTEHPALGRLPDGAQVTVLEILDGWYRVAGTTAESSAITGYVSADYLQVLRYGIVGNAQSGLNLRQGPGTEHEIAAKLPNGSLVTILETMEGWYRVEAVVEGAAVTGYVSAQYITLPS